MCASFVSSVQGHFVASCKLKICGACHEKKTKALPWKDREGFTGQLLFSDCLSRATDEKKGNPPVHTRPMSRQSAVSPTRTECSRRCSLASLYHFPVVPGRLFPSWFHRAHSGWFLHDFKVPSALQLAFRGVGCSGCGTGKKNVCPGCNNSHHGTTSPSGPKATCIDAVPTAFTTKARAVISVSRSCPVGPPLPFIFHLRRKLL